MRPAGITCDGKWRFSGGRDFLTRVCLQPYVGIKIA
jgi:hypothetical protein